MLFGSHFPADMHELKEESETAPATRVLALPKPLLPRASISHVHNAPRGTATNITGRKIFEHGGGEF